MLIAKPNIAPQTMWNTIAISAMLVIEWLSWSASMAMRCAEWKVVLTEMLSEEIILTI
jgi:hypothetical protein